MESRRVRQTTGLPMQANQFIQKLQAQIDDLSNHLQGPSANPTNDVQNQRLQYPSQLTSTPVPAPRQDQWNASPPHTVHSLSTDTVAAAVDLPWQLSPTMTGVPLSGGGMSAFFRHTSLATSPVEHQKSSDTGSASGTKISGNDAVGTLNPANLSRDGGFESFPQSSALIARNRLPEGKTQEKSLPNEEKLDCLMKKLDEKLDDASSISMVVSSQQQSHKLLVILVDSLSQKINQLEEEFHELRSKSNAKFLELRKMVDDALE